jgi:shikimate dehydrogenase
MGSGIDGSARVLGVVGDPIAQVRSPAVWTALFRHNAVNAVCVPLHVRSADLRTFFAGMRAAANVQALIATIPHKPAMLELVDDVTPRARQVNAVNAVAFGADRCARGDILDGEGLVQSLRARGQQIQGRRALIVGAGGVGSAIAFALAEAGATEVSVSDIASGRADQLAARLTDAGFVAGATAPDPHGYDVVVNATPMGMHSSDPLPFDTARLEPGAVVADVVIRPGLTPLLTAARARGCFTHPGIYMSDAQVVRMAEFFGFGPGDWSAEAIAELTV